MPQEINKENVTRHVLKMIDSCNNTIYGLAYSKGGTRTDGERLFISGEIGQAKNSLLYWTNTAELFGIEIPEEDGK